ncbi:hypothetical protein BDV36DRAFT_76623 [Aspergillus pseudocaelatus]|uniref:Uncharacterized protein n=1 Tax=Aspergillus pseudocaelatus TaxID=1825620 RepID=A0ABQ6W3N3_9EURO|nr:hypothetical protein BDV36DRAFT_76623 [Aspergillus pseudocaelatus]
MISAHHCQSLSSFIFGICPFGRRERGFPPRFCILCIVSFPCMLLAGIPSAYPHSTPPTTRIIADNRS